MQSGTIYGANAWGIGLKEKLLPQYLKKAGYKTHAVGKVSGFFYMLHMPVLPFKWPTKQTYFEHVQY